MVDTSGHVDEEARAPPRQPPHRRAPPSRRPTRRPTRRPRPRRPPRRRPARRSLGQLGPVLLLRAAHPRQALLTALAIAGVAAVSGRAGREVGVVFATVLVGQAMIGWHNDLSSTGCVTWPTSGRASRVADGSLDPGTVWFAIACGALLVVPLSITQRHRGRRRLPDRAGRRPARQRAVPARVAVVADLGGVVRALPGLPLVRRLGRRVRRRPAGDLRDRAGGRARRLRPLPARAARAWSRTTGTASGTCRCGWRCGSGAPRLLYLSIAVTVLVVAGLVVAGARVGLSQ